MAKNFRQSSQASHSPDTERCLRERQGAGTRRAHTGRRSPPCPNTSSSLSSGRFLSPIVPSASLPLPHPRSGGPQDSFPQPREDERGTRERPLHTAHALRFKFQTPRARGRRRPLALPPSAATSPPWAGPLPRTARSPPLKLHGPARDPAGTGTAERMRLASAPRPTSRVHPARAQAQYSRIPSAASGKAPPLDPPSSATGGERASAANGRCREGGSPVGRALSVGGQGRWKARSGARAPWENLTVGLLWRSPLGWRGSSSALPVVDFHTVDCCYNRGPSSDTCAAAWGKIRCAFHSQLLMGESLPESRTFSLTRTCYIQCCSLTKRGFLRWYISFRYTDFLSLPFFFGHKPTTGAKHSGSETITSSKDWRIQVLHLFLIYQYYCSVV